MADLKLSSQDAMVDVNAGLGGLHRITVTCRGWSKVYSPAELQDFADMLYPAISAEATKNGFPPAPPASDAT